MVHPEFELTRKWLWSNFKFLGNFYASSDLRKILTFFLWNSDFGNLKIDFRLAEVFLYFWNQKSPRIFWNHQIRCINREMRLVTLWISRSRCWAKQRRNPQASTSFLNSPAGFENGRKTWRKYPYERYMQYTGMVWIMVAAWSQKCERCQLGWTKSMIGIEMNK